MNCLIKKGPYKTDKSHILPRKTYTFHINMFLILDLLIYHLINVFFLFSRSLLLKIYSSYKKNNFLMVT